MSISAAHSAAARQNGAQSHGPVTDEGKARSAQNARKHGLFGPITLRTKEDQESFRELLDAYIEEFQPATIFENRCVREMVNAEWRLAALRTWVSLLEFHHAAGAPPNSTAEETSAYAFQYMANNGNTLSLALRYEKHFQRQFDKAHKDLTEARRRSAVDRQEIARRTDLAMANMLKAAMEAPLPFAVPPIQKNAQNEPKHPPAQPNNTPFNPTLRV